MGTHPIFESDFDCLTETKKMRQSAALCRRFRSKKFARKITGVDESSVNVGGERPRSLPHAPNNHFTAEGTIRTPYMSHLKSWGDDTYESYRRYGGIKREGRPRFGGTFTPDAARRWMHRPRFDTQSPSMNNLLRDVENDHRLENTFASNTEHVRYEATWWKDNWFKLDLIDPEKWAIFPGDVVKIVNNTHPDFGKFGLVQQIYQPHGLLWVDGVNVGEPIRVRSQQKTAHAKQYYDPGEDVVYPTNPLNYRDVKLLRFGRTALDLFHINKEEISTRGVEKDGALLRALDYLLEPRIIEDANFDDARKWAKRRRLKTFIQFEKDKETPGFNTVDGQCYNHRSFGEYHLALLEHSGILATMEVTMKYEKFDAGDFDLLNFDEMGATRTERGSILTVSLPQRNSVHGWSMHHEGSVSNSKLDVSSSHWKLLTQEGRLARDADMTSGLTFEQAIRQKNNIPADDEDVFYYRKLH